MTQLPVRSFDANRGDLIRSDARSLDRQMSSLRAGTSAALATINAAGDKWEEVLQVNTLLTGQVLRDTVQVAQAEAYGAQLVPHAAHRLSFIADQHAMQESQILGHAHRALGRLAQ
jgi:hypothetical protein